MSEAPRPESSETEPPEAEALVASAASHPILLFDGVCHLCHGTVRFILPRDPDGHFRFAPLQSPPGRALLRHHGRDPDVVDAVVLVDAEGLHEKSDASLRVARRLSGGWPLLSLLRFVPRGLRDRVYDFVARHRYRWFGRSDRCGLSLPGWSERFLA